MISRTILVFIGGLLIGTGVGAYIFNESNSYTKCEGYIFLNEDYACDKSHVISKAGYITLKNNLLDYIQAKQTSGDVTEVAIYFRDLRGGPIFGINDSADFAPASLLKLPIAIAYFDYEEEVGGILDRKIQYVNQQGVYPGFVQIEDVNPPLREGEYYTIEELIEAALAYSDNLAYYTLVSHFTTALPDGSERALGTLQELGILDPRSPSDEVVTVRNYTGLFRLLYSVAFLNAEHSEKILQWLSESVYTKGLRAGVPQEIQIAHKFGERELEDGSKQLHDCGIVYFPENPYTLCIMTKGADWEKMSAVIRDISKMTYEEVESRKI